MRFFQQSFIIAAKDLRSEIRSKETINASLSFSIVILLLFSFAFDPDNEQIQAMANFVLLLSVELISLPIFGLFYNVDWTRQFWQLMMVVAMATWGIAVVGTTFSAMTVNMRLRELMLPMLVYPILIPCLLAAIQLSADLIQGKPIAGDQFLWLKLLAGFDVIYTALSITLVDNVLLG